MGSMLAAVWRSQSTGETRDSEDFGDAEPLSQLSSAAAAVGTAASAAVGAAGSAVGGAVGAAGAAVGSAVGSIARAVPSLSNTGRGGSGAARYSGRGRSGSASFGRAPAAPGGLMAAFDGLTAGLRGLQTAAPAVSGVVEQAPQKLSQQELGNLLGDKDY